MCLARIVAADLVSTEMICVYLVNEEPSYIGILSHSLKMLRQHNRNVPIVVYYVQDGHRDTRYIPWVREMRQVTKRNNLPFDQESLSKLCQELKVEVRVRKPPQQEVYFSLHRLLLQEMEEETVLLLDGDTFVYGNIEQFVYPGLDFVATVNSWGQNNSIPGKDVNFKMFNSGVVLWQNGWMKKWAGELEEYCRRLKERNHPLSEWLWSVSPECIGREEFATTLFVLDHGLKYAYFDDAHVQTGIHNGSTLILHTLTPNWLKYYNEYFNQKRTPLYRPRLK